MAVQLSLAQQEVLNIILRESVAYARARGLPEAANAFARFMVAVGFGESGLNPRAIRLTDRTDPLVAAGKAQPEHSRGIFQLNYMGGRGNASGLTPEQALDPTLNTRASLSDLWGAFQREGGAKAFAADPVGVTARAYQKGQGSIAPSIEGQIKPGLEATARISAAPAEPAPRAPGTNRTFEQIRGTQYLSDAERDFYKAEEARRIRPDVATGATASAAPYTPAAAPPAAGGTRMPPPPLTQKPDDWSQEDWDLYQSTRTDTATELPNAPTIRVDVNGKGQIWDRNKQDFVPDPRWDAPKNPGSGPPEMRLDDAGRAMVWNREKQDWDHDPRFDKPKEPESQAMAALPRSAIPAAAKDISGTGTLFEMRQGNRTLQYEQVGLDKNGQPVYRQSIKEDAAAKPKAAVELAADRAARIAAQARGQPVSEAGVIGAAPPVGGGTTGAGAAAAPSFAGTGTLEETAPNQAARGQESRFVFGPTDIAGNAGSFSGVEVPTGPGSSSYIPAYYLGETLRVAGLKPSGVGGALTDEDVARAFDINSARATETMMGRSPLEIQAGYDARARMKQATVGNINELGQPIEDDVLEFARPGELTVEEPVNLVTDSGQTVARAAEVPGSAETISFSGVQPAATARVFPGTSELPAGSIGEDFEGNPLYDVPDRNWNGARGGGRGGPTGPSMGAYRPEKTFLEGGRHPSLPNPWQGPGLPVRFVNWTEMQFASGYNTQILGMKRRLENQGRFREAARLQFYDPYTMKSPPRQPSFASPGQPAEFAPEPAAAAAAPAPQVSNTIGLTPVQQRAMAVLSQ